MSGLKSIFSLDCLISFSRFVVRSRRGPSPPVSMDMLAAPSARFLFAVGVAAATAAFYYFFFRDPPNRPVESSKSSTSEGVTESTNLDAKHGVPAESRVRTARSEKSAVTTSEKSAVTTSPCSAKEAEKDGATPAINAAPEAVAEVMKASEPTAPSEVAATEQPKVVEATTEKANAEAAPAEAAAEVNTGGTPEAGATAEQPKPVEAPIEQSTPAAPEKKEEAEATAAGVVAIEEQPKAVEAKIYSEAHVRQNDPAAAEKKTEAEAPEAAKEVKTEATPESGATPEQPKAPEATTGQAPPATTESTTTTPESGNTAVAEQPKVAEGSEVPTGQTPSAAPEVAAKADPAPAAEAPATAVSTEEASSAPPSNADSSTPEPSTKKKKSKPSRDVSTARKISRKRRASAETDVKTGNEIEGIAIEGQAPADAPAAEAATEVKTGGAPETGVTAEQPKAVDANNNVEAAVGQTLPAAPETKTEEPKAVDNTASSETSASKGAEAIGDAPTTGVSTAGAISALPSDSDSSSTEASTEKKKKRAKPSRDVSTARKISRKRRDAAETDVKTGNEIEGITIDTADGTTDSKVSATGISSTSPIVTHEPEPAAPKMRIVLPDVDHSSPSFRKAVNDAAARSKKRRIVLPSPDPQSPESGVVTAIKIAKRDEAAASRNRVSSDEKRNAGQATNVICTCRLTKRGEPLDNAEAPFDHEITVETGATSTEFDFNLVAATELTEPMLNEKTAVAQQKEGKDAVKNQTYLTPFAAILNALEYANAHGAIIDKLVENYAWIPE